MQRAEVVTKDKAVVASRRSAMQDHIRRLELALRNSPSTRVSLSDISQVLHLEKTYCSRLFPALVGKSFSRWLREIRMACAQRMLVESSCSITALAHEVGYDDLTTFERNFRKTYGVCPTTYREISRSNFRAKTQSTGADLSELRTSPLF
jgi:AraC-like DNA-binding protein